MKFNKSIFLGLVFISSSLLAHKYDHLKIEELKLLVLEQEQKLEHKDKVIEAKSKYISFLEKIVHHYKHELHKEKDHIAYLEILRALGF